MNRLFSDPLSFPRAASLAAARPEPAAVAPAAPPPPRFAADAPGLNLGDVYFTLFRHKWKIVLCSLVGIAAAAAMYVYDAPPFQSEAKLFVRYIITENKALGPTTQDASQKSPDQRGETIMKSEAEILSSLDLARQVVDAVGAEKILARLGGGRDASAALAAIKSGLSVHVAPSSSVINLTFRHPDPEIAQPVLREVIARYLKLHVDTHTANGMLGDFLTQETDQLRSRLSQTEEELRRATLKAGIVSLEDAKKAYSEQLTALRRELLNAQAELAQRVAVQGELNRRAPAASAEVTEPPVSPQVIAQYQHALQQVQLLQRAERELLTQFTAENPRVRDIRGLLASALEARDALLRDNPRLMQLALAQPRSAEAAAIDPSVVATQITALEAKIKVLLQQLDEVRADATRVEQMEGTIVELRRKKELEEANYRYFAASLEQSRINEALGNGRVSNISQVQAPSPPFADRSRANKTLGLLLAGGLLGGIVWAFAIELYLDRSVKRSVDIERLVPAPLFLAIPRLRPRLLRAAPLALSAPRDAHAANGTNGANGTAHASNGAAHTPNGTHDIGAAAAPANSAAPAAAESHTSRAIAAPEPAHPLQPFHETLRDRLIGYFESVNLTHKPKLVAVTSLARQAGVSTTAGGLARSLSETGEGNVLLVDMNTGQGVARQFLKGRAVCGLDDLLDARDSAHVDDKLYVVAENSHSDRLSRNMPQRFTKLVPKLKASDFDYIIFDMPPVSQISITPRLAGFMDMVLMVVESEKTDREVVQRATALLADSGAHVGVVLNKTRRYVPARLHQDGLGNS